MTLQTFEGARVMITGGASGIGLALAKRMAADGAKIVFCDLGADRVAAAEGALPGAKGFVCDVSDRKALAAFIGTGIDHLGGLDVGWNNAGVTQKSAPLQDVLPEEVDRVMAVNFHAVLQGSQLMAQQMIRQGSPALLVNTGSENSLFHAVSNAGAYVASKMAVRSITQSLQNETPDFMSAKLLCPGFVNTALGDPETFKYGMDVEQFADITYPLFLSDQFYLVSHGYNAIRVREAEGTLLAEIEAGAASAEETAKFDVRNLMQSRG